jgi:hypothetical protein
VVARTIARNFLFVDGIVVKVVPAPGGEVPGVRRVVAAADGAEVADATVKVEDGPRVSLPATS